MPRHSRRTHRRLSLQVLDDRRVLAAIVGSVFHDANDSIRRDHDELGLSGRLVYVDQNDNARLDQGERYALSDSEGEFSIDDMPNGEYAVRLFNATKSQVQTSPHSAVPLHEAILRDDLTAALAAVKVDAGTPTEYIASGVLASGSELQTIAADGTRGAPVSFDGDITQISRLADGAILVVSEDVDGTSLTIIDDSLSQTDSFNVPDVGVTLDSVGSDDVGRGVAVAAPAGDGELSELWMVDRTDLSLSPTGVMVQPGTVVTSDTTQRVNDGPTRSVLSHLSLADDGNGGTTQSLAISFWSNTDGSTLTDPIIVSGASEVVAFHDEAGLLVLRSGDHLSVHDVDSGSLATLYTIDDTPPVAGIDAARGLIVTLSPRSLGSEASPSESGLRLLDSETGSVVADLAIDLSALGDIAAISLDTNLHSVALAGAAGMTQVSLRRPAAARASIADADAAPLSFGVRLIGDNSAPDFATPPVISVTEDEPYVSPAPGLLASVTDKEGDEGYVILPSESPSSGIASLGLNGQFAYTPFDDFEGIDTFTVILHDGRDATEAVVTINVISVPDAPVSVEAIIAPVPENILPADLGGEFDPIGVITIIDPDQVNQFDIHILDENRVPDPRFQVFDGEIVFIGPGRLDFENEWAIPLIFTVTDPDSETTIEYATTISVTDADDPISDIIPDNARVRENTPGEIIKSITVIDEDFDQIHSLDVDDDRFEVVNGELKLKDDRSLDREADLIVTINITASFGDDSFTKPFQLTVLDVPEVPENFVLSDDTVLELEPGDVVGDLTIAGNPAANGHSLTVNDPRFIFEGSTLRLADDKFIERTPNIDDEIILEVTATPDSGGVESVTTPFTILVVENDKPFHNDELPEDVNGNGEVSARDALAIINYLNTYGPGPVGEGDPAYGYDVNNDGIVTSLDALLVINLLNVTSTSGGGTVGNEPGGEPIDENDGSGAEDGIASASDADEVVPAAPLNRSASPRSGRVSSRDIAISEETAPEPLKTVGEADSATMEQMLEMLSADEPVDPSDESPTDQVFGEPEIDLLG
ncbi:dockerin type I domain-containing protein [Aporhodopirellula aestuarii]|uniref:Dockerin type I domain-containing protein n=1 Tax=Aporhodopirellula aestuarii TaxID=2950107 RepID=A0ABT0U110_9BACT|nr:dockerin type I domain-containing protein [Aporhodopirellula aestuarii]MCM2370329.1 dockerin type I domain-containing protein [Aporhodopirellula aestuarii]